MSHPPPYACLKKIKTMHSTETIIQFLNLRVQGWSFARIADQLRVSKPTLLDWNRKHQSKIESMKANRQHSAEQTVRVSDDRELQTLTMFYNALHRELISRTLKDFSADEIQALASDILRQINKLSGNEPTLDSGVGGPALQNAFGEDGSNPVRPSQSQSNQIQPPPTPPGKETVKKW
jgi:hypothetical protein